MSEDKNTTITTMSRGNGEEYQFSLREYKGKSFIDLRLWFLPKGGTELMPTKRGVIFHYDEIGELRKALGLWLKAAEKNQPETVGKAS